MKTQTKALWVLLAGFVIAILLFGDPVLYPRGAGNGSFLHATAEADFESPEPIEPFVPSARSTPSKSPEPSTPLAQAPGPAWTYEHRKLTVGGKQQSMHVLTADPQRVRIQAVLSFDRLFGFETLSAIDARYQADASVNGWFSHSDGNPAALVFSEGRIWHSELNYGASAVMKENTFLLTEAHSWSHLMRIAEDSTSETAQAVVLPQGATFRVNPWPMQEGFAFYTKEMGSTDRTETPRLVGVVERGMLRGFLRTDAPVEIPKDGFLVSASGVEEEAFLVSQVAPGDRLSMRTNLSYGIGSEQIISYDAEAQVAANGGTVSRDLLPDVVEIGGWLVRKGENVAAATDRYIGTLQTRAPRTAVGTLPDGQVLFLVVDGRQGASGVGLTGRELADVLLSLKVQDAALLDGGGNSQMMTDGKTVNKPSTGRERPMAFAFVLFEEE